MAKSTHLLSSNPSLIKLLFAIALTLSVTGTAIGRQLSPDEALSRLNEPAMAKVSSRLNQNTKSPMTLLRSISPKDDQQPALYLFSQEKKRVLVVSANDCAPALLGYFDNPADNLLTDSLPKNLEYWLSEYAAQIQYAEAHPGTVTPTSVRSSRAPIDYLVKTKWDQDEPYNLQCPEFGGYHCVTGCVATAFAQVMNYHKWPERGRGSHSYRVNYSDAGLIEYSIDFSEIEFDWDAMLNEYDENSSQRSKDAVAALMKACGYSVDMTYTTYSSGAVTQYIVDAAKNYFDYSDKAYYAEKDNYTWQQWENLIYDQLSKGLPLIYSGRDGIWGNSNGHCFICDGYDGDGYYHFNWGWGGYCDGYFLLYALTPQGVGIGGSAGGYNVYQGCIANFFPSSDDDNYETTFGYIGKNLILDKDYNHIYTNVQPEKASLAKAEMSFAVEFTSQTSGKTSILEIGNFALESDNCYRPQKTLTTDILSSIGLTDGSYEGRFLYDNNGEWSRLLYNTNGASSFLLTLAGSEINLDYIERTWSIDISNVKFNDGYTILKESANELTYTVTNRSDEPIYWASFHYLIPLGQAPESVSKSIYNTNLVLAPNETQDISLPIPSEYISPMDKGEYYVAIKAGPEFNIQTYLYADESIVFTISDRSEALSDGIFIYQDLGDGNVALIETAAGSKLGGDITLPDKVEINGTEYTVTNMICSLSDILDRNSVTRLDIKTPITTIPDYLFYYASNLISISFPSTLQTIGKYAFYYTGLTGNLKIPESTTLIDEYAFAFCRNLTGDLSIPNSVNHIGNGAFYSCEGFNGNLIIPESITEISTEVFANCSGLNGELSLHNKITSIGGYAFSDCSGFTGNLIIPESVTFIGRQAFEGCSSFDGRLVIPSTLETIQDGTFSGCSSLTGELIIPQSVTYIGTSAFYDCKGFFGDLIIHNNVTELKGSAFSGCSGFNGELVIPENVNIIEGGTFFGCSGLTGNLKIPESVISIEGMAFFGCSGFSGELIIPESVSSIGRSAFCQCSGFIGDLKIPKSITSIGEFAFSNCNGFNGNLIIPESVSSIGNYAFSGCYNFSGIKICGQIAPEVGEASFPTTIICVPITTAENYRNAIPEYKDYIYELADANMDESITVSDAVAVVNEVIGAPNSNFAAVCADINGDGRIAIGDATLVISAALLYNPDGFDDGGLDLYSTARYTHGQLVADNFQFDSNGEAAVDVYLKSDESFVALQADIILSNALSAENITLNSALSASHSLETQTLGNNRLRLIVMSLSNATLNLQGQPIITVNLHSDEACNLTFCNIIGATPDACDYKLAYSGGNNLDLTGSDFVVNSGVTVYAEGGNLTVDNIEGREVSVTDLAGRVILHFTAESDHCSRNLQPGIYIVTVSNQSPVKIRL